MISAEATAEGIATPEGLEDRHVLAATQQVLNEGLVPRDGTVLDRARRIAAAEPQPDPVATEAWTAVSGLLARSLPGPVHRMWIGRLQPRRDGDVLVLLCPAGHAERWVRRRYWKLILDAAARELDPGCGLRRLRLEPDGPEVLSRPAGPTRRSETYTERQRARRAAS